MATLAAGQGGQGYRGLRSHAAMAERLRRAESAAPIIAARSNALWRLRGGDDTQGAVRDRLCGLGIVADAFGVYLVVVLIDCGVERPRHAALLHVSLHLRKVLRLRLCHTV